MNFTKDELKIWYNNINGDYSINPKTNRKIKKNGPVYKKIEKEYNKLFKDKNNYDIKNDINNDEKDKTNVENKIINFLKREIYLRNTLKQRIYDFDIYENGKCKCDQEISLKINETDDIKEDIKNILEIVKNVYNDKKLQNLYGLNYECKIEQMDLDGNVYGFVFRSFDDNYEYPIILTHCYSKKIKNTIHICLHMQYLSFLNYHNNKNYDYETHMYIKY